MAVGARISPVFALALAGCPQADEASSTAALTGATTAEATTAPVPEATDTGTTGAGALPPEGAVPCTALDVLFVVDNSSTMAEEQVRLAAAGPAFVAAVRANLPAVESVHVGVIATDDPGLAVSAARCGPFAGGAGHMTQDDDLSLALACALQVGTGGSADERPIEALLAAVADLANQPGGFNADFVRASAPLVLVIVSDEEDDHEAALGWGSPGEPDGWFTGLTAIKGGLATNFVVLSLVGVAAPNACPPFQWDGKEGAEPAPRLAAFTAMFPFGRLGDVCAPSYDTFFFDALPAVVEACAGFVPVE